MTQLPSWSNGLGRPWDARLQAQIFFERAQSRLDLSDIQALQHLVEEYRRRLLGSRIELLCVGHADWRGSEGFNMDLAARRADEATHFINARLHMFPTYSSSAARSRGERDARVGGRRREMAFDRRVDVWSTYIRPERRLQITVSHPVLITGHLPPVRRMTHRVFEHFRHDNIYADARSTDGGSSRAFRELLDMFSRWLRSGGEAAQTIFGEEDENERQTEVYPRRYRVNSVHIRTDAGYDASGGVETQWRRFEVAYTWGEPTPFVTIINDYTMRVNTRRRESSRREQVTRADADSRPFIFPPDPR